MTFFGNNLKKKTKICKKLIKKIFFNQLKNSVIATTVAEIVTIPICLLKTNYQNTNGSIKETIRYIYIKILYQQ